MKLSNSYASVFEDVITIIACCDQGHNSGFSACRSEAATIRPLNNLKNRYKTNDIDTAVVISWQ